MVHKVQIAESESSGTYPKAVLFIVANEFCERFSYYGLRTILSLFLRDKLGYSDDGATVIYHIFSMMVYFFPLLGAMIADGWLGRYRTIVYLSFVYACGNILIAVAAIPTINLPMLALTILALLLIAFGTGGIKPCVSAFGGDQFKLPEQQRYLSTFFSLFYFAINAGSLISTFLTPVLRKDVHCFGDDDCYPLAFGVPGVLMIASIAVIVGGKRLYKIRKPSNNVLGRVGACIWHALTTKMKSKDKKEHWLDHAEDKYERSLIDDIKSTLRVLVLFIPLPVFWALFDQQGSRWTFQADRMYQKIGSWTLKADQMQVLNPLLILLFIPLFEVILYPAMTWCRMISKPLHKMIWGGIFAALAFVISGIIELNLVREDTSLILDNQAQLRVYNGLPCKITLLSDLENITILSNGYYERLHIPVLSNLKMPYSIKEDINCISNASKTGSSFTLMPKQATSIFISRSNLYEFKEFDEKRSSGASLHILTNFKKESTIRIISDSGRLVTSFPSTDVSEKHLEEGFYSIKVDNRTVVENMEFKHGAVYSVQLNEGDNKITNKQIQSRAENTMHILWLVPQYVIMTMGEVMFSVTGLEFSFTQAPESMKSVLTSAWLLTVAFGNLIVILIVSGAFLDAQWKEFFLFAGLMGLDMLIFAVMAFRYKYVEPQSNSEIDITNANGLQSVDGKKK